MKRPNRTPWLLGVVAVSLASTVSGCGGTSAYCQSVEDARGSLDNFGSDRTSKAFAADAKALDTVAKEAPEEQRKNYQDVAAALRQIVEVHESLGYTVEELTTPEGVEELSSAERESITEAFDVFNGTSEARAKIVENVRDECDLTLR